MSEAPRVPVLIADNDRSTRNVYGFQLGVAGYHVLKAPDVSSAIEVLLTHPTGMVALLDWEMPAAGCMRILRSLAHTPDAAARHRYVLLAYAPDSLHSRLLTLPASLAISLVRKPAAMPDLLSAVGAAAQTVPDLPSPVSHEPHPYPVHDRSSTGGT